MADTKGSAAPEERATSLTGAQKGRKLARFALIPWDAVWAVAEHFGRGARKYDDRNWEKGYPWSWGVDALGRHLAAYIQGEDRDPETGSLHIVAVAWHALVLSAFQIRKHGLDDRPKYAPVRSEDLEATHLDTRRIGGIVGGPVVSTPASAVVGDINTSLGGMKL